MQRGQILRTLPKFSFYQNQLLKGVNNIKFISKTLLEKIFFLRALLLPKKLGFSCQSKSKGQQSAVNFFKGNLFTRPRSWSKRAQIHLLKFYKNAGNCLGMIVDYSNDVVSQKQEIWIWGPIRSSPAWSTQKTYRMEQGCKKFSSTPL